MNNVIYGWIFVFALMLSAPVLTAWIHSFRSTGEILPISQNRDRYPRYFARSFAAMVEKNLNENIVAVMELSRPEPVNDGTELADKAATVDTVVVFTGEEFRPAPGGVFRKEIYTREDAWLEETRGLRAIACQGRLMLGPGTIVVRWADARGTLSAWENCDLGVCTSSATRLSVGHFCRFRRLFAPELLLGQYPGALVEHRQSAAHVPGTPSGTRLHRVRRTLDSLLNEEEILHGSVVASGSLLITENVEIFGDVRGHRNIRICAGVRVHGHVMAEGNVLVEEGAQILGSIFTQGNVLLEDMVVIGRKGSVSSVVARGQIVIRGRVTVYGQVSSEAGGRVEPAPGHPDPALGHPEYLEGDDSALRLEFADADGFTTLDPVGFRDMDSLQKVTVPEGVESIPPSFFFRCDRLQELILPGSLKEIGDYSFYGCKALTRLDLGSLNSLERIGRGAFQACTGLERVILPSSLRELSPAAFAGCTRLSKVEFPSSSRLGSVGSHAFMDCENLRELELPASVESIGISAVPEHTRVRTEGTEHDKIRN